MVTGVCHCYHRARCTVHPRQACRRANRERGKAVFHRTAGQRTKLQTLLSFSACGTYYLWLPHAGILNTRSRDTLLGIPTHLPVAGWTPFIQINKLRILLFTLQPTTPAIFSAGGSPSLMTQSAGTLSLPSLRSLRTWSVLDPCMETAMTAQ